MAETNTPTTAPAAKSTIGLRNFVIAPVTSDTVAGTTYGTLQLVAGAIEASTTPNNTDPDIQYADDIEFDVVNKDPDITFKIKLVDVPLSIQAMLLGAVLDDNGVMVNSASDQSPYFAVGFKSEKSDHTFRYVWLYKVRAKPITDNYASEQGATITRQNPEVEFTAIKRTYDGRWRVIADEGQNGFTSEMAATFLTSVYEPEITPPTP